MGDSRITEKSRKNDLKNKTSEIKGYVELIGASTWIHDPADHS